MSFLFPLYFLAASAVIIPLVLHLRRRPPQNVVPFSALMFLEAAPVPPVKRRRLEDLLLLLLRCLALLLLALMFARPLWATKENARTSARAHVILLDRSASMRRDDIRAQIAGQIDFALRDVREEDDAALVAFDREPHVIVSMDAWRSQAPGQRKAWLRREALGVGPGWAATDLGSALVFASGLLENGESDEAPGERRITVISDFQEGASLDSLGTYAWPQEIAVTPLKVEAKTLDNFTLSPAARNVDEDEPASPSPGKAAIAAGTNRVRIANTRGSKLTKYSVAWKGDPNPVAVSGEVAAGASRVIDAPARDASAGDGEMELSGDAVVFDNHAWFARVTPRALNVLCITDLPDLKDTNSPVFFLSRALQPGAGLAPKLVARKATDVNAADMSFADFIVVTSSPPAQMIDTLRGWISRTHMLLWLVPAKDSADALATLSGVHGLAFKEAASGGYAMLGDVRFDHPLMKSFAESGVRDFTKIRFWKHRVLALPEKSPVRRIASFDDGSAAIFEIPVGEGRAVVLTSGWTADESQLGVSSKFVPLLYSLLDYAGFGNARTGALTVGDPIPLDGALKVEALKVTLPGGATMIWNAKEKPLFTETTAPGIYVFGEGSGARSFAVNLTPSEGRIAPMDPGRLREFGVPLNDAAHASVKVSTSQAMDRSALVDSRREQKQKLWKIFAATAALVLLLETLIAVRFRHRGTPLPAAP